MKKLTVLFMTAVFTLAFLACDNSTSPPNLNRDPTLIHAPTNFTMTQSPGLYYNFVTLTFTPTVGINDISQYRFHIRHPILGERRLGNNAIDGQWISTVDGRASVIIYFDTRWVLRERYLARYLPSFWHPDLSARAGFSFGVSVMCPDRIGIESTIVWSQPTVAPTVAPVL